MTSLSEQDWERVNAWADGELAEPEAGEFASRLKEEPALNEALASVRQVSCALSALRPEPGQASNEPGQASNKAANVNRRPWFWAAGSAVAAAVAVLAVVMVFNTTPTALGVHSAYAAQDFQPDTETGMRPAAGAIVDGFALLRDANLYLVATTVEADRASAHFAGVNGCRLTVLRGNFAQPQVTPDVQLHQWIAENSRYQIIATGMDAGKFAATATYLEQVTQNRLQDATVLALRNAVQSGTTCRRSMT